MPFRTRLVRVVVSVVVLTGVTVVLGYGGWIVLTLAARIGGYDPKTDEGELLRDRLLEWPDRNREVIRSNGRADLPLRPWRTFPSTSTLAIRLRIFIEGRIEQVFDRTVEMVCEFEREFQRRIVPIPLDGVDRLSGDVECGSQVGLTLPALVAPFPNITVHRSR